MMDWQSVSGSSHIKATKYDSGQMSIRFADGAEYTYENVPRQMHDALISSDSPGSFFHRHIKGKFRHDGGTQPVSE
jgi:KTSC domain